MRRLFLLAALVAACSRPGPSPDYSAAREKHVALVAAHPLDAAARPEMDEVLALLDRVPANSLDAQAARELRDRIVAERTALADEDAARAAAVAKAGESPSWPAATSIGQPPPKPRPISPGMTLEELQAAYDGCFERGGPAQIVSDGKQRDAEMWLLKAGDGECSERHAEQKGQVVLVADGAVVAVRPAAEAQQVKEERTVRREQPREVELVPLAGGKWGIRGADGKVEELPPGAEVRTRDGAPLPPAPEPAR